VLRHANVIDGIADEPLRDVTVVVENGRIASVRSGVERPPDGAVIVDLAGRWLLPGLIDAHEHLRNLTQARALVASGVTTVRSLHSDHFIDVGIRELHRGGMSDLPDALTSGYMIRPDMSASEGFFLDFPELAALSRGQVAGADNVRKLVRANVRHGVDEIKLLATERGGTPETDPRRQTFTEEDMAAIVSEARTANLPVAAHAHGDEGAAAAVRSGARTIEHGSLLSDATLDLMRARGTCLIPTLALANVIPAIPDFQEAPLEFRERTTALFASAHRTAARAYRKGVPIAAGTDSGASLTSEIAELVAIGMPPMAATKAGTSQSAHCIGIDSRTGSVRPGLEADLLVVERNPLDNVSALNQVALVINDGVIAVNRIRK
jgi:imidazolonepropionase-like amidohydrolase